jgi:hypothetical protein
VFGSASADLMMSRAPLCGRSSTGMIPGCNRIPLLAIYDLQECLLDGGAHNRLLDVTLHPIGYAAELRERVPRT